MSEHKKAIAKLKAKAEAIGYHSMDQRARDELRAEKLFSKYIDSIEQDNKT
jgi:hypothetical protein